MAEVRHFGPWQQCLSVISPKKMPHTSCFNIFLPSYQMTIPSFLREAAKKFFFSGPPLPPRAQWPHFVFELKKSSVSQWSLKKELFYGFPYQMTFFSTLSIPPIFFLLYILSTSHFHSLVYSSRFVHLFIRIPLGNGTFKWGEKILFVKLN